MTKMACVFLLVTILTGCVVVSGPEPRPRPQRQFDNTVIDEITAAAALTFEDARTRSLTDIASRPHLSANAQVHLVQTIMRSLVFDSSKEQVLLALINSPYFVREGKQAVLDHIEEFAFDSSRQSILQALHRRGTLPSENEMKALRQSQNVLAVEPVFQSELQVEFETSTVSGM